MPTLADLERLADDRPAQVDDLLARLELAFERRLDVVGQVVDDVVLADLDAAFLGQSQRRVVGRRR